MRIVDLFCGAGGMSLGMKQAGHVVIRGYDFWQPALNVHEANLKTFLSNLTKAKQTQRRNLGGFDPSAFADILSVDELKEVVAEMEALGDLVTLVPEIIDLQPEMIVGGPPCQPWSQAGPRLGDKDPRARLTDAFGIVVCTVKPQYFAMENVPQIRRSRIFARLKKTLRKAGYGLTETILDASYYGVPQSRRRLLLIGCLGECDNWLLDHLEAAKSESQTTVADILGADFGMPHFLEGSPGKPKRWRRGVAPANEPVARFFWLDPVYKDKGTGSRRTDRPISTISRSVLAGPSSTYPTKADDVENIHGLPIPTFEQMARLGGFPETWDWSVVPSRATRMKILANAVPPGMAAAVGRCIAAHARGETAQLSYKVPREFVSWLKREKGLRESRLSQVISEFKTVQRLFESRNVEDPGRALAFLERHRDFQPLGASRKSNLRAALRLYLECNDARQLKNSAVSDRAA